jgi:hypothetical protein
VINKDSLTLIVNGGTPPYTHSIDNGLVFLDTNQFTELEKTTYNVIVKDKNGCTVTGVAELSSVFNIENTNTLQLKPNPVQNILEIFSQVTLEQEAMINIYNIEGKVIYVPVEKTGNHITVNVSSLSSGMYTVGIYTNNKVYHQKFIKE